MKYIVVIIPELKLYKIIFEDEFMEGNEFRTQNLIIEVLKLLGFKSEEFTCDLCTKKENKGE